MVFKEQDDIPRFTTSDRTRQNAVVLFDRRELLLRRRLILLL